MRTLTPRYTCSAPNPALRKNAHAHALIVPVLNARSQVPTAPAAKTDGPKKGGWGDSPGKVGGDDEGGGGDAPKGRRRRGAADEPEEEEEAAPTQQRIISMDDDDEPAGFIPDLEDAEEDLGKMVAVAPGLKSSRVPTIHELDEEIDMALPSSSEVGVDLSVLQSFLLPSEQCQEEDVPWDVEFELQTIASELQKEREEREGSAMKAIKSPKRKVQKEPAAEIG